jgi:myo-inositol-1(or 4)-monophosphatase
MQAHLDAALEAASAAARLISDRADTLGAVKTKSTDKDLVTQVDIDAGAAAVRAIAARFEGVRFVVEEREVYDLAGVAEGALTDDEVWVVDPLDGTTSFVHGFPFYSVSIALLRAGEPVVGVVHNVPADEVFSATVGSGATLGARTVSCSGEGDLDRALLLTGFPYDRTVTLDRQLAVFGTLMRRIHGVRRDGSAALDLCHVAAGRADGFWEFGLMPWDMAAGVLLAREGGAVVTDMGGRPWTVGTRDVVVAGPDLHPTLLDAVRAADPGR